MRWVVHLGLLPKQASLASGACGCALGATPLGNAQPCLIYTTR